jgi:hypothetical protein
VLITNGLQNSKDDHDDSPLGQSTRIRSLFSLESPVALSALCEGVLMGLFSQSLVPLILGQGIAHLSPHVAGHGNAVNESRSEYSVTIDVDAGPASCVKARSPFMLIPIHVGALGKLAHESDAASGLIKTNLKVNSRLERA